MNNTKFFIFYSLLLYFRQFDKTDSGIGDTTSSDIFKPSEQTMQEQLEDGKVIRAFWELRQEVCSGILSLVLNRIV